MNSVWFAAAMLTAFLFAAGNVLDKILREKHFSTTALSVVEGIAGFAFVLFIPFISFHPLPLKFFLLSFAGGALWFFAAFPYIHSLSIEEASRVAPLWSLQGPITLALAFLLGEKLGLLEFWAFWLVIVGAFLISVRRFRDFARPSRALLFMLLAASMISVASVIDNFLYDSFAFWDVTYASMFSIGLSGFLVFAVSRSYRKTVVAALGQRSGRGLLMVRLAVAILVAISIGVAFMTGPASLTVAFENLSGLFVLVIATFISRFHPHIMEEVIDRKTLLTKAAAILIIIAGIFMINL